MADTKITALAAIATVDPAADVLPIVDISDTSMAASGTTKKVTSNQILGAGGTATLASATITGDLTVDTSTLVVDATNDRVGIGTATPAAGCKLDVNGAIAIRGANPVFLYNTDNTAGFQIYNSGATGATNSNCVFLSGAVGVRATLDASGNFNVANGNLVMGTSGKGIDFSAVTGGTGTATANVLNDYEEGTFTPTIAGNTIAGVGVYSDQYGRYTKVGRLVTCQIFLNWTAHTGTGNMFIEGLPFATASISGIYHPATIGWANNIALTAGYVITGYAGHNASTIISFQQYPTGGGAMIAVPIDTLGGFIVSISYIT